MGSAEFGVLFLLAATFLACRMIKVPPTLPVLAVALLFLQVGTISASAVPGLAQLAAAKASLDNWTEEKSELPSGEDARTAAVDGGGVAHTYPVQWSGNWP